MQVQIVAAGVNIRDGVIKQMTPEGPVEAPCKILAFNEPTGVMVEVKIPTEAWEEEGTGVLAYLTDPERVSEAALAKMQEAREAAESEAKLADARKRIVVAGGGFPPGAPGGAGYRSPG